MTEPLSDTTVSSISSAIREQNIRFKVDLPRLRDAWRAVAGLNRDGSITFVVSASEVRLQASDQLTVEGIVPISEVSGFDPGTALHLTLAGTSFSALGIGELPQSGHVVLNHVIAEEGFTGVLRLETEFVVQFPYTVTSIGIDAVTLEPVAGTSVDPRTIRSAISEIRDFAGTNVTGYDLGTLQVFDEEALGMSAAACNAIKADRFKAINLRFPASCAKVLGVLLSQLQPADTKLTTAETNNVLFDGRIRVTIPVAATLPAWPEPKTPITQLRIDAPDFQNAIGIIGAQNAARGANASLVLAETSDTLTISVAVPGGEAIVSCPVSLEGRAQSDAINLRVPSQTLAMFRSPHSDILQIKISERIFQIEQNSTAEFRKMLVLAVRPQNTFK